MINYVKRGKRLMSPNTCAAQMQTAAKRRRITMATKAAKLGGKTETASKRRILGFLLRRTLSPFLPICPPFEG
jgi:hypothetical protein